MMDPSRQVKRYEPGRAAKYSFRYAAVAAMSIVNRICMFVFSVGLGIGQGFQPVSAFNYGAKKYGRVRKGFYFTLTAGEVLLGAIAVIGMFFPAQLVAVFQKDPEVVAIGEGALRVQLVALFSADDGLREHDVSEHLEKRQGDVACHVAESYVL